jgi:hypothetical protein
MFECSRKCMLLDDNAFPLCLITSLPLSLFINQTCMLIQQPFTSCRNCFAASLRSVCCCRLSFNHSALHAPLTAILELLYLTSMLNVHLYPLSFYVNVCITLLLCFALVLCCTSMPTTALYFYCSRLYCMFGMFPTVLCFKQPLCSTCLISAQGCCLRVACP